ncbi:hypothetical protein EUTSA_v10005509mg [Eutrema salsugineum]|uniref:Uncharacterized protein n=1 Tax=Eutrema salsugineum TaxID=72664 RepID=V4KV55_EUTSA|nr:uncharacterized protein LOC18012266 [Eutrema salsugineum]ESQ31248.1 hypothetical protein EUTSA_v10005509mg [Eutrema salsugineum]
MTKSRITGILSQLLLTAVISPILAVSGLSDGGDHERFKRRDPLNSFRYYDGGFDVRDKHYWAATAFIGIHGYAVAGVLIIAGVCLALYIAFSDKRKRVSSTRRKYLDRYCLPLFLLLLLFMILSMATTGMVIAANQSSKNKTEGMKETIDKAGEDVERNIRTVITSLTKIQYLLLPYDHETTHLLNVTTHRLGKGSRLIHSFVHHNGRSIDLAIKISYVSHLVITSTNLFVLLLAFAPLLLHWHPGFIMVIFLCWILTTLCWVLTGFDFFLHTFAEDVCSAFTGFVQNPQNSTLTNLFPCMDPLRSDKTLIEVSLMIHNFITELNSKVADSMRSNALTDGSKTVSSVPESGLICDPFVGQQINSYTPQSCSNGAIPIGEFPNILSRFTCHSKDPPETCRITGKFIPEAAYLKVYAYSNSAQGMLDILPSLQNLTQCLAVKDTLSSIVSNQCKPFRASMYRLWALMLALSLIMKVLLLLFLAKALQEKGKSFAWFSINPTSCREIRLVNI